MWIVTTNGFLTAVQSRDAMVPHDALVVRGRVRADLERFADFAAGRDDRPAVVESPDADYGYRLTTSRETLAAFLAGEVGDLHYPTSRSGNGAWWEERCWRNGEGRGKEGLEEALGGNR